MIGISLLAIMGVLYVGTDHLIAYFKNAPSKLYLSSFVSGAFYSLWLIVRPCLFLVIGWTIMQGLSLLPKAKILRYDTKYAHKIIVTFLVIYFLIVGVFCAWVLYTDWQVYRISISGGMEGFHSTFSFPVAAQCIRFFANHRHSLWAMFIPLGMALWVSAGRTPEEKESITDTPS